MDSQDKGPDRLSMLYLFKLCFAIATVFWVLGAIRRVYFHPLSKFKGPKWLAVTNLVHIWYVLRGQWVHKVLELHEKYGSVVRVAPNEIFYISEEAWNDIYKSQRGQVQLKKYVPVEVRGWENDLFDNPQDEEHALIRKKVSPALSDRGVREREPILLKHVSFLAVQLKHALQTSVTPIVNIVGWYQAVTTDIIGDFLSGEDFNSLLNSRPHPVLEPNYQDLKGIAIGTAFDRNIVTQTIFVKLLRPPQTTPHTILAKERFDRHLLTENQGSADSTSTLVSLLTKGMDTPNNLTPPRVLRVTADFILAGTDTVAITLSGATYLLLRNPEKYAKWRHEVRSAFSKPEDITLAGVNALKYQNAVIMETLRLWPPGPETTRRVVTPGGKMIDGEFVPAGALVGVYHWAAGHYSRAWRDVEEFVPERWLTTSSGADNEYANDDRGVMQPYHLGPRNCVGQSLANAELRLILATMIWHFDMELEDPRDEKWMKVKIFGLVAEKKPLRVKVTERRV